MSRLLVYTHSEFDLIRRFERYKRGFGVYFFVVVHSSMRPYTIKSMDSLI